MASASDRRIKMLHLWGNRQRRSVSNATHQSAKLKLTISSKIDVSQSINRSKWRCFPRKECFE